MSHPTSGHEHLGSDSAEVAAHRYLETGDLPECEVCRSEVRAGCDRGDACPRWGERTVSGLLVKRAEAWAAVAMVALLPLVQALLLLAAGYVGARLASRAAGAAVRRMGEERLEPATELLRSAGLSIAVPDLARRLVFVTVLVVVIAQASAVAGLGYFGNLADSIIHTIPAVCIGLGFLLVGIVAGRQAGRLVAAMAARGPIPAGFAGAATQAAIVAAAAVSAVDAMGISTTLPVALIALSVAALFGLAVAAGVLAARGVLENIAAARYVEETLIEGQRVRFRGEEAEVEAIGILATVLRTVAGTRVTVPNSLLQREAI